MNVCLLAPTPFSKYSMAICAMLLRENIELTLIICPSIFSVKRLITYWKRERLDLLRKIWLKILVRNSSQAGDKTMVDAFCDQQGLPVCRLLVFAKQQGLHFETVRKLNSSATAAIIKKERIDLIVFSGGGLVRPVLLESVPIGILNCHWGLLPRYRGMDTVVWAEWEKQPTGITLHYMDKGIDNGLILKVKPVQRKPDESIAHFKKRLELISLQSIVECVVSIRDESIQSYPQIIEDGKQYFVLHKRLEKAMVQVLETQS